MLRMRRRRFTGDILFGLLFLSACGDAELSHKGEEENTPHEGSFDSWYAPTEHGELEFGVQAAASLSADRSYHVWDFTIEGPATVALSTGSSNRALDTVMYLYKRNEASWGHYVERNDDAGGGVFSHIDAEVSAGTYRVVVKGFKRALHGDFVLEAGCTGPGCPSRNEVSSTPTHFGDSCVPRMLDVLMSDQLSVLFYDVGRDGVEYLAPSLRTPILAAIEEATPWDVDDWYAELTITRMAEGTLITLDDGEDMSLAFLFDVSGHLLVEHITDQSPWTYWYCGQDGELGDEEPDGLCVDEMLRALPHRGLDEPLVRGQTGTESDDLAPPVFLATSVYRQNLSLNPDTPLNYSLSEWELGSRVSIWSESLPPRDYLISNQPHTSRRWVLSESTGTQTALLCREFSVHE